MNNEIKQVIETSYSLYGDSNIQMMVTILKRFLSEGGPLASWGPDIGLCSNAGIQMVESLFPYWDKYSGSLLYPISGLSTYDDITIDKYAGEQLELRLDLAKFIIECFVEYEKCS